MQARAADVLWDTDPDRARELFRRAWEAAEIVDEETAKKRAEEMKRLETAGEPVVVRGGPSLRSEVLRLVAKRDRKLGEEFLKALDEAAEKARSEAAADQRRNSGFQVGGSQRLQLARRLVEDGEVERALEFARPALESVNIDSIFFLSALREKNAQLADAAYTNLLARAARDPNSDANTVSGLSSYLLTPFLYITFERDGGANQNRQRGPTPPPAVDDALRNNFLKVAFQILMQPLASTRSGSHLFRPDWKIPDHQTTASHFRTVRRRSRARFAHANDRARVGSARHFPGRRESCCHQWDPARVGRRRSLPADAGAARSRDQIRRS